ncbi:MAG: AAA family ATPase [Coriobacteriaceae bacterium]|nr:AAA family ATPase [Coriobacteriaceae bacterium]
MTQIVDPTSETSESAAMTAQQVEAFDAMMDGRNVFLTGNAGTGKSFVLNRFIEELESAKRPYVALAPTGIAAQNLLNGTTIHRTLQIGFGVLDPTDQSRRTLSRKVLAAAEVVIIDEISMCRVDLFERVMGMVLMAQRGHGRKQVVLVGDFFQLPPVVTDRDRDALLTFWPGNPEGYCFKSRMWRQMCLEPHVLTEVVRQSDPDFIDHLNRARLGGADCIDYFNQRAVSTRRQAPKDDLWLCATNRMASTINDEAVAALVEQGAAARTYSAVETGDVNPSDKPTDDELRLVKGARVMLLANMPASNLSNGSIGTVEKLGRGSVSVLFDGAQAPVDIPVRKWEVCRSVVSDSVDSEGRPTSQITTDVVGTYSQIPLRLAFAITIHKSQGQTFERCVVHSKVFGTGMLYVALSRCTNLEGLTVWPKIERGRIAASPDVVDFYEQISDPGYMDGLAAMAPTGGEQPTPDASAKGGDEDMVSIPVPARLAERVLGYVDALTQGM